MPQETAEIYFDNNATTRVLPEVLQRMEECWSSSFANPGSQHGFGRRARQVLEDSRESVARILNADASEVIFTSGGTESLNMVVHGMTTGRSGMIALTAGEHPATVQAAERCRERGFAIVTLQVDHSGLLVDDQLEQLPWEELKLVCVILAHNETGVIQDVRKLSQLCSRRNVPLLLDAVQAVGKIPVDFAALGATALAFGAHKFHGPRGIGGLLLKQGTKLSSFLAGGHQENGRRPGTEPVPLIAGMTRALDAWQQNYEERTNKIRTLRDRLEQLLTQNCSPVIVHGQQTQRLPNTLSIAFPGVSGESLLVNLHLQGVACSLGSTCASGSAEAAPALLAMGIPEDVCHSSVRFSVGILNTMEETQDAADKIAGIVRRLRQQEGH
jgi:cysteine desulfurase